MDLRMPDLDGIEATRRITDLPDAPAVVVLTMFEDDGSVFAAMRAGARGYLLKGADQDEILRAIRAAAANEAIFGPEIAARVIAHFARGTASPMTTFPSLTEREHEVLQLIAAGKGNATIAHGLVISLKTVRNHVSNILPSSRSPTAPRPSSKHARQGSPTSHGRGRTDSPARREEWPIKLGE